jgi:hypothetical protein
MATDKIIDVSRANLRTIVTIHRAMFDKLLEGDDSPASHELVALFEDIAATYTEIHLALRELAKEENRRTKRKRSASKPGGMSEQRISVRNHGFEALKTSLEALGESESIERQRGCKAEIER